MKYIFDFDGVLFDTFKLREKIFVVFEEIGISRILVKEYFERERWNCFSLKKMLAYFSAQESLYEEIMKECKNFSNEKLLKIIKTIGKDNCFIITYGDKEFQQDKIKRTNIVEFFFDVVVVQNSKNEAIEKICIEYGEEEVIFIDDSVKHFEDLNLAKYPNLRTILYTGQDLSILLQS